MHTYMSNPALAPMKATNMTRSSALREYRLYTRKASKAMDPGNVHIGLTADNVWDLPFVVATEMTSNTEYIYDM